MTDKLLDLATSWKRKAGYANEKGDLAFAFRKCATELLAILDADGDMRRHAERYRWLRARWGRISETYEANTSTMTEIGDETDGWDVDGGSLDRCIDAAMEAGASPLEQELFPGTKRQLANLTIGLPGDDYQWCDTHGMRHSVELRDADCEFPDAISGGKQ